jgi:hypothetical protein
MLVLHLLQSGSLSKDEGSQYKLIQILGFSKNIVINIIKVGTYNVNTNKQHLYKVL